MTYVLNRRRLLDLAVKGPLLLSVSYAGVGARFVQAAELAASGLSPARMATLQRISYLLFPYPELGPDPYHAVVASIVSATQERPELLDLVERGIATMDRMQAVSWLQLGEAAQIGALQQIESDAFFQFVYQATLDNIYNDPRVWKHIGYEGSSLEFGGYLQRGFNDIDWL